MKLGKINTLSIVSNEFTSVLTNISSPPKQLFVAGSLPLKRPPTVAIVGSRKPTTYGIEVTHQLAYRLAKRGVVIVSGLAFGIDVIAHKAALEASGTTIAVLANGLHRIYPAQHTGLAETIIKQGGAIISEKDMGDDARAYDFLARNRIVSGLADAVIVTEATERSGTLSTVGHALDQNKEVFAVPGPFTSLLSVGPNKLLQQGAHVALDADDILSLIAPQTTVDAQILLPLGDTPLEVKVIELIQKGVRNGEELQKICGHTLGVTASEFLQVLTAMELKGSITAIGGNRWGLGV